MADSPGEIQWIPMKHRWFSRSKWRFSEFPHKSREFHSFYRMNSQISHVVCPISRQGAMRQNSFTFSPWFFARCCRTKLPWFTEIGWLGGYKCGSLAYKPTYNWRASPCMVKLDDGWPESEERCSEICKSEDGIAWSIKREIYQDISEKKI